MYTHVTTVFSLTHAPRAADHLAVKIGYEFLVYRVALQELVPDAVKALSVVHPESVIYSCSAGERAPHSLFWHRAYSPDEITDPDAATPERQVERLRAMRK